MKDDFQLWLELTHTHTHTPQIVDSRAAYFAAKKEQDHEQDKVF